MDPVSPSRTLSADEVVSTDAEREALARVRELTGEADGPMERHGLRCHLLCERLAAERGLRIDGEVTLVAGLLHDMGLYEGAAEGGAYVTDGRHYAERMLAGKPGWEGEKLRLCLDAIERHHELRPQWEAGDEVELMRRADLVELSAATVNFGLDRGWIRGLWAAVPRRGIYGEIGKMVTKAFRERPLTMPMIFLRGRGRGR
jgi:hypothetical protein